MTLLRHPAVRRFLVVLLGAYLLFGPVSVAAETGLPWAPAILVLGAACAGCFLWALRGGDTRRSALLLAVPLAGGLVLNAVEYYSGLGLLYPLLIAAPLRARPVPAVLIVAAAVAGTGGLGLLLGMQGWEVMGNVFGMAYAAVLAFLLRHMRVIREQGAALAEARAGEAVLADRARLAREVHDILAHSQSAQIVHLEGARLLLERGDDPAAALDRVNRAVRLARTGLEETRRALDALRGRELPLPERLERLAVEFRSATGAPCAVSVTGNLDSLRAGARLAVARTAQEALTNVRRHAPGAAVSVALRRVGDWCELQVRDTGGGAPDRPVAPEGGYGLVGMRERAELIGGSLAARPGAEGFEVLLRVPA
ncbi:histidine kinase [Streptosporangium sp. NPDC023615]|uniref:sensor histidine kinase n=1 Tax=Streptosporangium sp. NPDC023615 TaxID=3154794 RepID=UPI0034456373